MTTQPDFINDDETLQLFNQRLGDVATEEFLLIIPLNEIIELCGVNRNEIITESVYKILDELMEIYHLDKNNTIKQMNEAYFTVMLISYVIALHSSFYKASLQHLILSLRANRKRYHKLYSLV